MQLGYKLYKGVTGSMVEVLPTSPKVLMRLEKGQALTHLEMDNNLGSLYHTGSIVPRTEYTGSWEKEKYDEYDRDQYLRLDYAPITETLDGEVETHQYSSSYVKLHKSIPEILTGIANEEVPGNLNISGGLFVTESSKYLKNLRVEGTLSAKNIEVDEGIDAPTMSMDRLIVRKSGSIQELDITGSANIGHDLVIGEDLWVKGGNAKISGSLWVDGVIYGNISGSVDDPYNLSDARLKDIQHYITSPVEKINQIAGYNFIWNEKSDKEGQKDVGLIAQEVQEIIPEAVRENKDGYLELDYCKVIPLLIEAIKRLSWEIEELKKN